MAKGGGSGGGTQTVIQESNPQPPAIQLPYLQDLYKRAQTASNKVSQAPYTGNLVARPTGAQTEAVTGAETLGRDLMASGYGMGGLDIANATASGDFLRPESNPYLQDTIAAALRPVEEQFFERTLPSIGASAASAGAFGGSDMANLQQAAARDFTRTAGDIASNIAYGNYANERNIQLQSPQLLQGAVQGALTPANLVGQAGQQQQGFEQDLLTEAYKRYQMNLLAPFTGLPEFAALLGTGNFGGGTQSQTSTFAPSGGGGGFGSFLQGALGLGAAAAPFFAGGATPWIFA